MPCRKSEQDLLFAQKARAQRTSEKRGRDVDKSSRDAVETAGMSLAVSGHKGASVAQETDTVPRDTRHGNVTTAVHTMRTLAPEISDSISTLPFPFENNTVCPRRQTRHQLWGT